MKLIAIAALLAGCAFAQDSAPYMIVQNFDAAQCAWIQSAVPNMECQPHVLAMVMRLPSSVDSVRFTMTYTDSRGQLHQDSQTNRASYGASSYGIFISGITIIRVEAMPLQAETLIAYSPQQ